MDNYIFALMLVVLIGVLDLFLTIDLYMEIKKARSEKKAILKRLDEVTKG